MTKKELIEMIRESLSDSVDMTQTSNDNIDQADTTVNVKSPRVQSLEKDVAVIKDKINKLDGDMASSKEIIEKKKKEIAPKEIEKARVQKDLDGKQHQLDVELAKDNVSEGVKISRSDLKKLIMECIKDISSSGIKKKELFETLTYDDLVKQTNRNWSSRFDTVKDVSSEAPEVVILKDGNVHLTFDYISRPSTTGIKHKGQIMFLPDERKLLDKLKGWWSGVLTKLQKFVGKEVPPQILKGSDLRRMKCKVSCDCEDFKYRFEVADKNAGASDIRHSNGASPNITNPNRYPGICKHLLAVLRHLTDHSDITIKRP